MEKKEKKFEGFVKPLSDVMNVQEKKKEQNLGLAKAMFEYSEKELEDFVDSMVKRAERLVDDLKRERVYFNEKKDEENTAKQGLMSRADCFGSMLGTVQNCFNNYSFQDASRYVANYEKNKAIFNVLTGKVRW
jgi:hypothetical protein